MKRLISLWLLWAGFCSWSHATSDVELLVQRLNALTSVSAQFKQELYNPKGKKIQTATGQMYVVRPGKFRWETLQPEQQLLISDAFRVWVYDRDLQQVTIHRAQTTLSHTPAALLSGNPAHIAEQFKVSYSESDEDDIDEFELIAKKEDNDFTRMTLFFRGPTLIRMQLRDHLGQRTVVSFPKMIVNPSLKSDLFKFQIPKGVDVIDNTAVHSH